MQLSQIEGIQKGERPMPRMGRQKVETMQGEVDTEWFMAQLEASGYGQRAFARNYKVGYTALHRSIHGQQNPTLDMVLTLSRAFKQDPVEIIHRFGYPIRKNVSEAAVSFVETEGVLTPVQGGKYIPTPRPFLHVAQLETGDYAMFPNIPAKGIDAAAVGRLAVARVTRPTGQMLVIGRLVIDRATGRYSCFRGNGLPITGEVVDAAPVEWVKT